ncbi:MAG: 50S ribosomal protein L19 [Rickettsiales bacterium]|nr:50S ribosomal protein L19 [Actinomycetota bacterium]MBA94398.1 50S ribosomal protein L19 [Rickettsiales bacterium]|tara:strand:+ start:11136 stop:11498 length:363 start_codon:yes stop_codon:yes gene_type:complete
MTNKEIQEFEKSQCKENVPSIKVGDSVIVHKVIMEGKKQRTQRFQGTVIKKKGSLSRESFTVRKIIDGVGVEKTFLLHSPLVPKVDILKEAKIRRAKLYYLRDRVGAKANRLKVKADNKK